MQVDAGTTGPGSRLPLPSRARTKSPRSLFRYPAAQRQFVSPWQRHPRRTNWEPDFLFDQAGIILACQGKHPDLEAADDLDDRVCRPPAAAACHPLRHSLRSGSGILIPAWHFLKTSGPSSTSWLPTAIASTSPFNQGHSMHWYSSLQVGLVLFSMSPPSRRSGSAWLSVGLQIPDSAGNPAWFCAPSE